MAVSHIQFNHDGRGGRRVVNMLAHLESGFDLLNDELAAMALMLDGDGSSSDHFEYFVREYGFGGWDSTQGTPTSDQKTLAKSAWDELQSLAAKLNTTGQGVTTSFVKDALLQAFAKFR